SQSVASLAMLNPLFLGIAASVGGSVLIERLRSLYKHYEELAIPIILSAGIGFGAIFISLHRASQTTCSVTSSDRYQLSAGKTCRLWQGLPSLFWHSSISFSRNCLFCLLMTNTHGLQDCPRNGFILCS